MTKTLIKGLGLFFLSFISITGETLKDIKIPQAKATWSKDDALKYEQLIKTAAEAFRQDPKLLQTLSLWDLKMICNNISGIILKDKFSPEEWTQLRATETSLYASIIYYLHSRIDPSIDTTKILQLSYPPYDFVYPSKDDRDNNAKRQAYNDSIQKQKASSGKVEEQIEIKQAYDFCLKMGNSYLKLLYPNSKGIDPDEIAELRSAGLDQTTINQLLTF